MNFASYFVIFLSSILPAFASEVVSTYCSQMVTLLGMLYDKQRFTYRFELDLSVL